MSILASLVVTLCTITAESPDVVHCDVRVIYNYYTPSMSACKRKASELELISKRNHLKEVPTDVVERVVGECFDTEEMPSLLNQIGATREEGRVYSLSFY